MLNLRPLCRCRRALKRILTSNPRLFGAEFGGIRLSDVGRRKSTSATPTKRNDLLKVSDHVKKFLAEKEEKQNGAEGAASSLASTTLLQIEQRMKELEELKAEAAELVYFVRDNANDKEILSIAEGEQEQNQRKQSQVEEELLQLLLPRDVLANSNTVIEITAGVGGQEAMLFASDLFNMYLNLVPRIPGWQVLSSSEDKSDIGGLRHCSLTIGGANAYRRMKHEGGIHRVQRIPKTERSGRIHTSTVAVAVLPQPSEIMVSLNPKDLHIETKRSSGAGGQHVNTTESAVRVVHLPTGIAVENQTDRSQIKNKELALQRLRALLYEKQVEAQMKSERRQRKLQDRVTDHRIGLTVHNLPEFLAGGNPLLAMLQALQTVADQEDFLAVVDTEKQLSLSCNKIK